MTVRVITFNGTLQWALAPCIDQIDGHSGYPVADIITGLIDGHFA